MGGHLEDEGLRGVFQGEEKVTRDNGSINDSVIVFMWRFEGRRRAALTLVCSEITYWLFLDGSYSIQRQ
jgi:hypothetical protein